MTPQNLPSGRVLQRRITNPYPGLMECQYLSVRPGGRLRSMPVAAHDGASRYRRQRWVLARQGPGCSDEPLGEHSLVGRTPQLPAGPS